MRFEILNELIYSPKYKTLSSNSKIIYIVLRDKLYFSIAKKLYDSSGRYYVTCEISEVEALLNCSKNTAIKVIKELESFGLITKFKLGKGNLNKFYINQV